MDRSSKLAGCTYARTSAPILHRFMATRQTSLTLFYVLLAVSGFSGNQTWAEDRSPALHATSNAEPEQAGIEFFEKRIRPLLAKRCYSCHGPSEQESNLRLDHYRNFIEGGLSGPALVPGQANASLMITAVRYIDIDLQMPPDDKLSEREISDLIHWIDWGAPHPQTEQVASHRTGPPSVSPATEHWAFQYPVEHALPPVKNSSWPQSAIDRFILKHLEAADLAPAPPTDRRSLLRRTTFDLTGLPPTHTEIETFLTDKSPNAFAQVVDRLLASPHYGERWGRHWLDVVRYADSNGLDENIAQANAWHYRDYVIGAFNHDKPFDQFVREQIAGDLLPDNDPATRNERLIATGFLVLGPKVLAEVDETKMEMDIVDEQIDTISKAILGLTFGCARCHDHKFDPITMKDYYALAGIFKSTHTMDSFTKIARWHENPLIDQAYETALAAHQSVLTTQQADIDQLLADATEALKTLLDPGASLPAKPEISFPAEIRQQLKVKRDELASLKKKAPESPSAMGVQEGKAVEVSIHIRGSHLTLGEKVPRRIPAVFANANTPKIQADSSGRLALANWLTAKSNPLTARVIVNRVWRWHFGRGLVATPDNFGVMGEPPTHAKLLDWLSLSFMQDGWSLKRLHRRIMLSATYQMNCAYHRVAAERDPQNKLHWRVNLRRLEAEELRDALLSVSGLLDLTMGGPSLKTKNRAFVFNHTSKDETTYDSKRRSVYLPIIRNHLHDSFTLFDYTDASMSNGNRNTSTVASQALYLMNSNFLAEISQHLADLVLAEEMTEDPQRINWLYETTLGRPANHEEIARVLHTMEQIELANRKPLKLDPRLVAWRAVCQTLLMSSEFIYVH